MKQIHRFWNWFQDNEQAISNAIRLGINTKELALHLNRNLGYVSKRIGFYIITPVMGEKSTIIFSGAGYRKLFPKLVALEELAPKLEHFIPQAFIKPMQDKAAILDGTDAGYNFGRYRIRISELRMALVDYNIQTKQLRIRIYISNYDSLKKYSTLQDNLHYILMVVLGEIAYRKHIKGVELDDLPNGHNGLLNLIELPDYIDYLYQINSPRKTRFF